jgi:hypothetical protein
VSAGSHRGNDGRYKGLSYAADDFETIASQALAHVSAGAELAAKVIAGLADDRPAIEPASLARIEHERNAALAQYRRDRDTRRLEDTMARLDEEEAAARQKGPEGPTAAEAVGWLRDLPKLWEQADGSGRKLLAEAMFERVDVLGVQKVRIHPTPTAVRYGWAEAWNGAKLLVMVGARGFGPAGTHFGSRLMPIEGAEDWEAGCLRTA